MFENASNVCEKVKILKVSIFFKNLYLCYQMNFEGNYKIQLAYDFVFNTNKNIFLTGKAGTGKTTFLRHIKTTIPKRMAVVAPTGVAAINAGGVTIHSFFQLPFTPFIPKQNIYENLDDISEIGNGDSIFSKYKLSKAKIKVIKSLDLLVIDEISMVRADLLDAIDEILRAYRRINKPFGGIQLLMIGDLYQLAPVIREEEWSLIKDYYNTSYFFGSNALRNSNFVTIELDHIYRQSDDTFISLLAEIRENKLSTKSLDVLNSRYICDFIPNEKDGYITLTTHNATALNINESRLEKIKDKTYKFKAKIIDDFPEYMYPTEEVLELKIGAQVMFVKNDPSFDKLFYNGKIGKITRIEDDIIYVKCEGDFYEIPTKADVWNNVKYSLNEETKEIGENIIGQFEQYPLRLAWAITIHKSQGLTFEKAVIDINAAFAFGQVYVALSRCKTLEGLVLMSKLSSNAIKSDYTIKEFSDEANVNTPDNEKLNKSKFEYQKELIIEQFDFNQIKRQFYYVKKLFAENISKLDTAINELLINIASQAKSEIFDINDKFISQIKYLLKEDSILPQDNVILQERVRKAASYYLEKLDVIFYNNFVDINFDSDNKEVKKIITESIDRFERSLYIKTKSLEKTKNNFEAQIYLKSISDADLDFTPKFNKNKSVKSALVSSSNNDLYSEINAWRKAISEESNIPLYMVLPQKSLMEIVKKLPSDLQELSMIKGFGKVKIRQYGSDILEIIDDYCIRNNITRDKMEELIPKKKSKPDTKLLSLKLFNEGKTIQEIAMLRGLVESTIYGHISYYIANGEIEITKVLSADRVDDVIYYLSKNKCLSLRDLYEGANKEYTYEELKLVLCHMEKNNKN